MAISAENVKQLRVRTGAGIMDCKKALLQTDGDVEKAIDTMRKAGTLKAAKKQSRITVEGLIVSIVADDNSKGLLLEVNCETDFVARSNDFRNFVDKLSQVALDNNITDVNELENTTIDSKSIENIRTDLIAKVGENIAIRRMFTIKNNSGRLILSYIHGQGRIGVLVGVTKRDTALAKDIALHITANKPEYINKKDISKDLLDKEREIYFEQVKKMGKPDNILEKMVEGKLAKFIKEITLYGQGFVKDPNISIEQLLKEKGADIFAFGRFEVGEGIDKKQDDFVNEVKKLSS